MPPSPDLSTRIRDARHAAGLKQKDLAAKVGTDIRTVQGWESGQREPRDIGAVERALGTDLRTQPGSTSPHLDEAADAQLIAELAGRLAERNEKVRTLTLRVNQLEDDDRAGAVIGAGRRWAARENHDTGK